jgi:uncharacterized membrane protein
MARAKRNSENKQLPSVLSIPRREDELAHKSQRVSVYMSLAGLSLMIAGFFYTVLRSSSDMVIPGQSALTSGSLQLITLTQVPLGFVVMSAGILVLTLLPAVRVGLALWIYTKQRNKVGSVTALVVLLELIASTQAGG